MPRARRDAAGLEPGRVFVLGAGFSYGARLPLAYQLLPLIHNQMQAAVRKRLLDVVRFLYPRMQSGEASGVLRSVGIEELMSLLDMSERFNRKLPAQSLRLQAIAGLRRDLLTGIRQLLLERQLEAEASNRIEYIDRFVGRLRESDTIVTFNWDTLLERRLQTRRFSLTPSTGNGIAVLKLHGSIDWCMRADLAASGHLLVIHREICRMRWSDLVSDRGEILDLAPPPAIVPPTFLKDFDQAADLGEIWATAFKRLKAADEVHFCGYRLPLEDLHARFVLRRALRANAMVRAGRGLPPPVVRVVNPDRTVAEHIRSAVHREARLERNSRKFETSRWGR